MKRHHLIRAAFAVLLAACAPLASAQGYPNKPVKVIIPFPPGGTLDAVGRMLAQKLQEQTGQTFFIENKPGGNGTIGADAVAKTPADGYTLLFNASTFTTAPMTMKSAPYDVVKDFQPIALVAQAPLAVSVNNELPVKDIRSLVAHAKANPGKLTFAIGSTGSAGNIKTVNDATPNVGDVVTYTITVSNTGPDAATNVSVEDVVPNGLSGVTNISGSGYLTGSTITWTGLTVPAGGSVTLTFQATVEAPGVGVNYVNMAEVTTSDQYDPDSTPDNGPDTTPGGGIGSDRMARKTRTTKTTGMTR